MFAMTYHEDYNKYDLGLDHPLVGNKPKKTIELIKQRKLTDEIKIYEAKKAQEKEILRVHTKEYVDRIKQLSKTGGMLSTDTPAPKGIFEIASLATGGSILAGEKLFENYKIAANPLAGFHHASINSSSGFCFFNDIAIVIEHLREKYKLKRFLVLDLDVHHGNGTQDIYSNDPTVLNISFHQDGKTLYPGTGAIDFIGKEKGEGYTINLPLPPGTGSLSYTYAFEELIPGLINQFEPEIILYQSGVDTHFSDPLADLCLTYQTYFKIANKMKILSEETCDKLLVLFGGGYNSDASVLSYLNIVLGLLDKNQYLHEEDKFSHQKYDKVKNQVLELKNILKPHWSF